jgi:quercetin dioxygenase-like cupin family protein
MSQTKIGKIKTQMIEKRGWLVGQFMDDSEFKDPNIEIYYKTFPVGDTSDKLHYHPQGKEYMIVLDGKAKFRIGEELLSLEQGDYIAIPSGTPDQIVEVLEEFTVMGVRYPSIPDNKIFIEK